MNKPLAHKKRSQKEGHLLVNNQKVGQKVQINVLFGPKVGQILTYVIAQTKSL